MGCGWGAMVIHAAREYGVRALGQTLSRRQAEWAQKAIAEAGLGQLAEVRHLDYRDVRETDFDAISSIGLTEHVGIAQLSRYFRLLDDRLRPGGRLLNHCITLRTSAESVRRRWFINRYVFPDGELTALGRLVSAMHDTGSRGSPRREPARTLRADHRRLVGQPRRALGPGRRGGRRAKGPGLAPVPGRRPARL